jgi:type IV pilus assembly protein PilB
MSKVIDELIKEGLITSEQLSDAKAKQRGAKEPLQDIFVELGFVKEDDLLRISSKVLRVPVLALDRIALDTSLVRLIPYEKAKRFGMFPLYIEGGDLAVAMSDPDDVVALDDIRLQANMPLIALLATKSQISELIRKHYFMNDSLYDLLKNKEGDSEVRIVTTVRSAGSAGAEGSASREDAPAVKLLNMLLSDAVKARASDIHIEPQTNEVEVRYRVDGDLKSIMKVPLEMQNSLLARLKVIANLDVAESRKPQDGRMKILVDKRTIDVRVSMLPTYHGETAVLRILDPKEAKVELSTIGFSETEMKIFEAGVTSHQGIVLVTGPTGSGKTSTLYAALNRIKGEKKNIVTIEDPIEYLLDGINQTQVNPVKDVTFASGLRSILRQDPNVILVGEIRDKDTADIAFRSSLTGHLVMSTLHTNNAVASITRLLDIGLESYLIASSLSLVVAQRLVRLICPYCKEEYFPDSAIAEKIKAWTGGLRIEKLFRGKGCQACGFSGFLGRTALFELLEINESIKKLITDKASEAEIARDARANNHLSSFIDSGFRKVAAGMTTVDEVLRVAEIAQEEKGQMKPEEEDRRLATILVVDDMEDLALVLQKRLVDAGYAVIKASNGQEAIESVFRQKPDLIVMDVNMPILDGFAATKILRSRIETAALPIMLLTAKSDKESELEGLDAGADDYLTKPFDKDKLLARVKLLLRRSGRERLGIQR